MIEDQYLISFELLKDQIDTPDEYPFDLQVVKNLNSIKFHKNVTFLIGENGTGKSTLLEALAIQYGFNPEGGSKNFNFSTMNSHSRLSEAIRITKGIKKPEDGYFLRAETFYNVASQIDQIQHGWGGMHSSYGGKSLHDQSHGESFFSVFLYRLFGNGVYMFDEPEAALSPQRQLAFLLRLDELVKLNSQFVIATHSPIILSYPNAKVIEISNSGLQEIDYKESQHYNLYKTFLENLEYMLNKLGIEKD